MAVAEPWKKQCARQSPFLPGKSTTDACHSRIQEISEDLLPCEVQQCPCASGSWKRGKGIDCVYLLFLCCCCCAYLLSLSRQKRTPGSGMAGDLL